MKHIQKGPEPTVFTAWKGQANAAWTPTWNTLQNPEKDTVKDALIAEQGGLCAYCCGRVTLGTSHIEHVAPRNASPGLALDYSNFVASCPGEPEADPGGTGAPHCGHAKGNWSNPAQFVDPRDPSCQQAFTFTAIGEIRPDTAGPRPSAADETIKRLNLNGSTLQRRRSAALRVELDRLADVLRARGALRRQDVDARVSRLRSLGRDGTFVPFQPALLDVLGQRAASLP
jgi:uncharacterized protein (TIGR02646 family)